MTDRNNSIQDSTRVLTSALSATSLPTGSDAIRARNRRHDSARQSDRTLQPVPSESRPEGLSDDRIPSGDVSRSSENTRQELGTKSSAGGPDFAQFLGDSWAQSWTSVQAFASNIISNGNKFSNGRESVQGRARVRRDSRLDTWGPVPPSQSPITHSIAAGSPAHRQAALKAAKTASVLESHEGVNGGLDISGKHKRRKSDEHAPHDLRPAEQLVYIHEVQPNDTYAGIVLRYKCREDIFRKANRLWSRDSVQTRKWLILPVDACEIKGRPLGSQSWHQNGEIILQDRTPLQADEAASRNETPSNGDSLAELRNPASNAGTHCEQDSEDDRPWTHVSWVQIDSFMNPVQIARVSRHFLGFFPPRRKRSARNTTPNTSPRQSLDWSNVPRGLSECPSACPVNSSSRQPLVSSTPLSSHSREDSEAGETRRPSWMRRPGGVGSMNLSVREPGPDKDYLNTWAKKHLPGLDLDTMPSMSVMGSESAHFGFGQASATIVENPFEEGRDLSNTSRQGSGLDRAAAAVEHWLRVALAKRPSTPLLGNRSRPTGLSSEHDISDLIELTNASEEDKTPQLSNFSCPSTATRLDDTVPSRDKTNRGTGSANIQEQEH